MNEYNPNNPSEMLHLLLDSELESGQESTLFSELANNEELRSELNDMLAIRNSVRRDSEAYTPPASATNKVFAGLGFAAPAPEPEPIVDTPSAGTARSNKMWFATIPVIGLLLFLIYPDTSPDSPLVADSSAFTAQVINPAPATDFAQENAPITAPVTSNIAVKSEARPGRSISARPVAEAAISENEEAAQQPAPIISYSQAAQTMPVGLTTHEQDVFAETYGSATLPDLLSQLNLPRGMLMQVRGIGNLSGTNGGANSFAGSLSNFNFCLYPIKLGGINIGIEAGTERYMQTITSIYTGEKYTYQRTSDIFWVGLSARYLMSQPIDFTFGGTPFVQASFGGATQGQGIIWKSSAGLQYSLFDNTRCFIGLEYGGLEPADNNAGSVNRIGLTYGLNVSF